MEIEKPANCPKSLFKFYSNSQYNLEAFLENYIYVSHPYQFNDLMDTRPYAFDVRKMDKMEFDKLKQDSIDENPEILNHYPFNWEGNYDLKAFDKLREFIFDSYFSFAGLASFADKGRFNELMWSHYAKESGFMIEFDTQKLINSIKTNNSIFDGLILGKVKYRSPIVGVDKYKSFRQINKAISYQKSKEWEYEREWRIIALSSQFLGKYDYFSEKQTDDFALRKLHYDPIAIKRIYLGKKFWTNDNYVETDMSQNEKNSIRKYICQDRKDVKSSEFKKEIEEYKKKFGEFIRNIQRLVKDRDNYVYMSAATSYCMPTHRLHDSFYNNFTKRNECKRYYMTRAFELIKDMSIGDSSITVTYSRDFKYRNAYFDSLD